MSPSDAGKRCERKQVWKREKQLVGDRPTERLKQELEHACTTEQERRDGDADGRPATKGDNRDGNESSARRHALGKRSDLSNYETPTTQSA